ncbi:hypothetical protein [Pseudoalteromonas tunicata]|uniref:hypothetical protein n=1 Tax=Pseudoalteromonas tunicata TaxID=314281 RepID=UPI00273F8485|nr:hypothetical protein [Pseudoalteromonas tunicata]MDP4982438.1 hypothetical protein [Pseudoalteromonas tunicata]
MTLSLLPAQYGYKALLLIDGSVHPPSKMGVAGYRLITDGYYEAYCDIGYGQGELFYGLCIKSFQNTSSTHLEINGALWALDQVTHYSGALAIVSDCQTLCQLPLRRARLEAGQFCNQHGQLLALSEAYQKLFSYSDRLLEKTGQPLGFIQLKGHSKVSERNSLQIEFAKLDQAVRKELRLLI